MCTNTSARTGAVGCHFDPGKTVVRPRHVTAVSVHYAEGFADGHEGHHVAEAHSLLEPPTPLAWCNHYW